QDQGSDAGQRDEYPRPRRGGRERLIEIEPDRHHEGIGIDAPVMEDSAHAVDRAVADIVTVGSLRKARGPCAAGNRLSDPLEAIGTLRREAGHDDVIEAGEHDHAAWAKVDRSRKSRQVAWRQREQDDAEEPSVLCVDAARQLQRYLTGYPAQYRLADEQPLD